MNKQKTPEEKLLGLIRKKRKFMNGSSGPQQPDDPNKTDKQKASDRKRGEFHVLRNINWGLFIVALCMAGYCLAQLFFLFNRDAPVSLTLDLPERDVSAQKTFMVNRRPADLTLWEIERRDVFQSPWTIKSHGQNSAAGFSDLNSELKLVGIVLDDDPKAVVIDLRNKRTLFLSEGEQVNGIFVELISEDKVLLLHNGRQVELVK